jgi:protoheme IX farnesyltransferase
MTCELDKFEPSATTKRGTWILNYIRVLKPRETVLLTFIGLCAALVAWGWQSPFPTRDFLLAALAILIGSGGTNGLTNYIDRDLDAKMKRVRHRPLPSQRIFPPQKMLPWAIGLVICGLIIAWHLDTLCFLFGALGVIVAITWRKRITCVFPQGALAGCSPVIIGYVAISHSLDLTLLFLCLLITFWTPLHVWSIMITNREDYRQAGINYFPVSREVKYSTRALPVLAVLLLGSSIALHFYSDLDTFYLTVACILGIMTVVSTTRLLFTGISRDAWKIYKLTAFPYLGIIFLAMVLDLWLS